MNEGVRITKEDVGFALERSPWDLGNKVLYDLCQNYSKHDKDDAIIAKVWLIGRSYAAAIERRKNAAGTSDNFYETTVVEKMKELKIDEWLAGLPEQMTDPWSELGSIVTVHKKLMKLFFDITELEKRSLASKYLHFHKPNLFFIYDSRAKAAITKVTPRLNQINQIKGINADNADKEYLEFCRRCQCLKEFIKKKFAVDLTPRQIDKILLRIADRRISS